MKKVKRLSITWIVFLFSLGFVSFDVARAQVMVNTVTYDYYVVAGHNMIPTPPVLAPSPPNFTFTCGPAVYNFGNITREVGEDWLNAGYEGTPYGSAYAKVNITNLLGSDITITDLTAEVTAGTPTKPFYFSYAGMWFGNYTVLQIDRLDPWPVDAPPQAIIDEVNYYTGEVRVARDGDWSTMAVGTPYPYGMFWTEPVSLVEPDYKGDAEATGHVAPIKLRNGSTFTEYFGMVIFGDADVGAQINGTITLTLAYTIGAAPVISIFSPENGTYPLNDVLLNFTVDEPTDWMGYSLNGQANVTTTKNETLQDLLDGSHYVVIYANDTAGDMGSSRIVHFTVDTTPPNITEVSQTPPENNVLPENEVVVSATVADVLSEVKQVTLNYTNGNGTWITVPMTNLIENVWNALIPRFSYGTNVTYIVMADDEVGNTITTEEIGYECKYQVIPEFSSYLILPLLMLTTLLSVIVYGRKRSAISNARAMRARRACILVHNFECAVKKGTFAHSFGSQNMN